MKIAGARAPCPERKRSSCGRRIACAAVFVSVLVAAPSVVRADGDGQGHADGGAPPDVSQLDPQTAAVARRLWGDLVCLCDRCERLTLSHCHCPDAARERRNIVSLLRGHDLGSPSGADAAYQAVVKEYVTRFGGRHVLASEASRRGAPTDWLALAVSVGVVAAGCTAVAILEYRRRGRKRLRPRVGR